MKTHLLTGQNLGFPGFRGFRACFFVFLPVIFFLSSASAAETLPFYVYSDASASQNHFVPSGWMGDWGDITVTADHAENCHEGATCIKVVYSGKQAQGAKWAGIYWQDPPNNWGAKPGGFDLRGAAKVTFWARGEKGGEVIDEFRIGGIPGEYFDSDVAYTPAVTLSADWKRYEIDLAGRDLESIKGGFMWSAKLQDNKDGVTFYLDEIRYE